MGDRAFRRLVDDASTLADRELRSSATLGGSLLQISDRGAALLDEREGTIAKSLDQLRRWAAALAPPAGTEPRRGRRLGIFPAPNPARVYARRWAEAEESIQETVANLRDAAGQLRAENARVAEEDLAAETQIRALTEYGALAKDLDARLSSLVEATVPVDGARAEALKLDVLYELRRRQTDILTQLAVATQARAALRVIEQNNQQLIDAITTATTTTLGALQTAAAVGQALEVRRHLQGLRTGADGGEAIPATQALQQAWTDVGETLNQVERLRRQVAESAALLARSGRL
ncbi:MAG TPA: toxic anion resistance protein [Candidatus Solibacter sp.]|nr:toxic anion resistance protein [Candidatus Solibacter sp.]